MCASSDVSGSLCHHNMKQRPPGMESSCEYCDNDYLLSNGSVVSATTDNRPEVIKESLFVNSIQLNTVTF
jgi:hypothetical protein